MSFAATLELPVVMAAGRGSDGGTGGGSTLDEQIVGVWEDLAARGAAACPVCETGTLRPVYGAHARSARSRCDACWSELT